MLLLVILTQLTPLFRRINHLVFVLRFVCYYSSVRYGVSHSELVASLYSPLGFLWKLTVSSIKQSTKYIYVKVCRVNYSLAVDGHCLKGAGTCFPWRPTAQEQISTLGLRQASCTYRNSHGCLCSIDWASLKCHPTDIVWLYFYIPPIPPQGMLTATGHKMYDLLY